MGHSDDASPRPPPGLARVDADAIAWVDQMHRAVDELTRPVVELHGERLRCAAGCTGCCADGLTVFAIEGALIVERHGELLASGTPHVEGACAFLDGEGRCRVYDARPYVCRTQGLPLRWLDEDDAGEPIEARDICPLNDPDGPPLEELPETAFWTLGPIEQRLAARQGSIDGGVGERVALRDLFARTNERGATKDERGSVKRRLPVSK